MRFQPTNQPTNQRTKQSVNQLTNECIPLVSKPDYDGGNEVSTNQTINQLTDYRMYTYSKRTRL